MEKRRGWVLWRGGRLPVRSGKEKKRRGLEGKRIQGGKGEDKKKHLGKI